MAYIIPSDISQLALAGGHTGELETLQTLKLGLPSGYSVFHGVHWTREYAGHTVYGEVDFVIVNQSGEILLIEQKNGALVETSDGLVKRYGDDQKNVGDQIKRSIDKIKEKFKWIHHRNGRLDIDYLIYCPDHQVKELNSAALDLSRIVDAVSSDGLGSKIEALLGQGATDEEHFGRVFSFFEQTFEIVPDIHAHISANEKSFTRLSTGLTQIIQNIEMTPLRLCVDGTAGSGKSAVGRLYFDKMVDADKEPLFVCFNRPLAEKLKHTVRSGGYVNTWYGLCAQFLEDQGHKLDYERMYSDPEFWNGIQELVMDESIPEKWLFDFLIVDEGQDFEPIWYDLLQSFMREGAGVLWLQDGDQKIRSSGEGDVELDGFVRYRCRTNYRTPESISRFVQRYSPYKFECANDLPGLGVGVHRYDNADQQTKLVASVIDSLVKDGFTLDDIVILSCRGMKSSYFSDKSKAGKYSLRRFEGEYDLFGNQIMSSGRVIFDTIFRFKGQQSPAIIMVDVDPDPDNERSWKILHTGMTRATVRLEVIARQGNSITDEFSAW
jgi:hypothetical protein